MQPPDGSYPGSQGPQGGDPVQPGYPQQGGSYPGGYYPQQPPPQQAPPQQPPSQYTPQQGYPGYPPAQGYGNPYATGPQGWGPPPPKGVGSRGWFWITLAAVVVIAAAVISTLVVTGGSDGGTPVGQGSGNPTGQASSGPAPSTDTTTSGTSTSDSAPPTDDTSSDSTSSTPGTGGGDIGRTFSVDGQTDGEKLSVTLVAVDQNARSTTEYDKPEPGSHFVATEYKIRNIGTAKYTDAIDNCVFVYDAKKTKYRITIVQSISSGNVIDEVALTPGQSTTGWLVYPVPIGTSVASATFTPDSGIADTTLTWSAR